MLTHARLLDLLHYDEASGRFFNRITRSPNALKGDVAGSLNKNHGYIEIRLDKQYFFAQELVWFYKTGQLSKMTIDHIDHVRHNNRWSNLREGTRAQNSQNMITRKDNASGMKGLTWDRSRGKWAIQLWANGKKVLHRRFDSRDQAIAELERARKKYHGDFACKG